MKRITYLLIVTVLIVGAILPTYTAWASSQSGAPLFRRDLQTSSVSVQAAQEALPSAYQAATDRSTRWIPMYIKPSIGVNLRSLPTTASQVLIAVPYGYRVMASADTVTASNGWKWRKVKYGNKQGYMYAPLLGRIQSSIPSKPQPQSPRPTAHTGSLRIPSLMYHRIGNPSSRYQVSVPEFREQMQWLKQTGHHPVTLNQVYNYLLGNGSLPSKPVMLTFDDGWADQWTAAVIMHELGFRGTFFIILNQQGLTDAQIRQMIAWGNEIESHTMTHPWLTRVSDQQLQWELTQSKRLLEQRFGIKVRYLAYPYGAVDSRVENAIRAAGYRGGIHAWGGYIWNMDKRWVEPRIEVDGGLSLSQFAAMVD